MNKAIAAFLKKGLTRKTKDNRIRLGWLFYVFIISAILWGYRTCSQRSGNARQTTGTSKVNIDRAVAAATNIQEIDPLRSHSTPFDLSNRAPRLTELAGRENEVDLDFFATLQDAQTQSAEKPEIQKPDKTPNDRTGKLKTGPTPFINEEHTSRATPAPAPYTIQPEPEKSVVYQRAAAPAQSRPEAASGFALKTFLPLGHTLRCAFIGNTSNINPRKLVTLGIVENVVFNGRIQIPFGTRIYGRASAGNTRDRLEIEVSTLVYPDGRQTAIEGTLIGLDGDTGVPALYIPQPAAAQAFPFIAAGALGYIEGLSQESVTVAGGAVVVEQNRANEAVKTAASDALKEGFKRKQDELDRRFVPFLVVPDGTEAVLQLSTALDLTKAEPGGTKIEDQIIAASARVRDSTPLNIQPPTLPFSPFPLPSR